MLQVITSSPIRSNPSTEMIDRLFLSTASFSPGLISGTIIVFDGYTFAEKEEWKQSRINQTSIDNYKLFKSMVKERFGKVLDRKIKRQQIGTNSYANVQICFYAKNLITIEHDTRVGFALALYSGLEFVHTPLVLINQHDWIILPEVPLGEIIDTMEAVPAMNYIGFVSRRSTQYHLKYNQDILLLNNLSFCKLFFWFDRIHIARTDFYKTVIFNNNRFKKGDFIEDTFGHVMLNDCKNGSWEKYNAYMYCPNDGLQICCSHLNGRTYVNQKERENLISNYKSQC